MQTPAWLTRIGADPRDDEDLRHKKSLLVLLAVLILPVSIIWGTCYLSFGSPVGIIPFVYFAVSLGSLVIFARTKRFGPFVTAQLLAILLTTTIGQMVAGGFLPGGGAGLWGLLAPLGALVFLEVRQAIRWFVAFLCAFVLLGVAGELFFPPAPVPHWFTATMLALNVVGTAAIAFTVLASFANQRNAALAALRIEQARSEVVDTLDRLFSLFDGLVEQHGLEKIKTIGDCYMAAAGVPDPCADHAQRAALLALDMRAAMDGT